MFRKSGNTKLEKKNFGVGSIIIGSPTEHWLVVSTGLSLVAAVDLHTYTLTESIVVEDIYWLSNDETRELVNLINELYTYSDYTFNSTGFKDQDFKEFKY